MGQNPAGVKMCLASQPWLGERFEGPQHITLPCRALRSMVHVGHEQMGTGQHHRDMLLLWVLGSALGHGAEVDEAVPVGLCRDLFETPASHFRAWKTRFSSNCSQRTEITEEEGC